MQIYLCYWKNKICRVLVKCEFANTYTRFADREHQCWSKRASKTRGRMYGWVPSLLTWNYHNIVNGPSVHFSSVQFSRSVVSDSLRPHESKHARPPCSSPTPRVYSDSCPSSRWCHPTISSSVIPFSSCPQTLPASGSFPMSQLFTWGGQSIGVSASASVLPMNTQDCYTPIQNVFGLKKYN